MKIIMLHIYETQACVEDERKVKNNKLNNLSPQKVLFL
jgi:hypothetical protein